MNPWKCFGMQEVLTEEWSKWSTEGQWWRPNCHLGPVILKPRRASGKKMSLIAQRQAAASESVGGRWRWLWRSKAQRKRDWEGWRPLKLRGSGQFIAFSLCYIGDAAEYKIRYSKQKPSSRFQRDFLWGFFCLTFWKMQNEPEDVT